MVDAGVDHAEAQLHLPAEDVDRGAAGEEVLDHLPGDVLRIGRHARPRRAVVAGEDDDLGLAQFGFERLLDEADLKGECLQAAKRAERLGLAVDLLLQRGGECLVRGNDVGLHEGLAGTVVRLR